MRLGLIVNPIAGIGGRLALKGSDGELSARALAADAACAAGDRAAQTLAMLREAPVEISVAAGPMGGDAAAAAGFVPFIAYRADGPSTAADTRSAAQALAAAGVDLLLFAGGDGTARDMMAAVGDTLPVLGIPAGVKMHSAVFATSPRAAGALVAELAQRGANFATVAADVLDRPGPDRPAELYGALRTPRDAMRLQPAKASVRTDPGAIDAACRRIAQELQNSGAIGVLGPGSTMQHLKRSLGFDGTLLGVDVVADGKLVAGDADEEQILAAIAGRAANIVLGVVGGQGFLLGRGNQQISPKVVAAVGRDNIRVIAGIGKLAALPQQRLLVESGDPELDGKLAGYLPVWTDGGRVAMTKGSAA